MRRLKILLVHSFYGSGAPSGENIVYKNEKKLLKSMGYQICEYNAQGDWYRHRGLFGKVLAAFGAPFNLYQYIKFRLYVHKVRPDIIHVHNTFPGISPSIFWAIGAEAPVVLTLHNYRIFCASGMPVRNGRTCTKCIVSKNPIFGLRSRCYRDSTLATLPVYLKILLHRAIRTWEKKVTAFIALSSFQKDMMCVGGLPRKRIFIKPNFLEIKTTKISVAQREDFVLFIGRLSKEKGVDLILKAWREMGEYAPALVIAGNGPLANEVRKAHEDGILTYLGSVKPEEAIDLNKRCRLLLFPSIWFEGFPMVLLEGLSYGTPIICSDLGSMPEIINYGQAGILVKPGSVKEIIEAIRSTYDKPYVLDSLSDAAFEHYCNNFSLEMSCKKIDEIYSSVLSGVSNG